jgi:hypothetical protein
MLFYVGLHQPSDARHFERACVSVKRMRGRQRTHIGHRTFVIIDSGAFTELALHGRYRSTSEQYAASLRHLRHLANIEIAVAQDYMCEPFMLQRTGLSVDDHQRMTVERYDALLGADPRVLIMPVLQGYEPSEYVRHIGMYGDRLSEGMWVGVGSVCKRNSRPEAILVVVDAIRRVRPDLRLHGFGVKRTALMHAGVRSAFYSTDSMAWSFAARRQSHGTNLRNDWREAKRFKDEVDRVASIPLEPWQMVLDL